MLIPSYFGSGVSGSNGSLPVNFFDDAAWSTIATGAITRIPPVRVMNVDNSMVNDATFQLLDLKPFGIPEGATLVLLELGLACGTAPDTSTQLTVRTPGYNYGGMGGLDVDTTGDGSEVLLCDSRAGVYAKRSVWLALSPDYQIEVRRVNPNAASRYWKIFMKGYAA